LDPQRFPFAPARAYTPEPATIPEIRALHKALHTSRVVIIQPSMYATDNACVIDAVKQLGPTARGIAAIGPKVTDADLDEMHRAGIRGIRINLMAPNMTPEAAKQRIKDGIERIKTRSAWHIESYAPPQIIAALSDQVSASPIPISFDHMGGAQASKGVGQPGFDVLLSLLHSGKAYVKISAPYRCSNIAPDYPDAAPIAKALIAANPQRAIWGTDWPHPGGAPPTKPEDINPFFKIDDGLVFNQLAIWAPDASQRKLILVDNPVRLYGF
jgi:predicted TIM-barrel fold metal-dependent hydrolase